MKTALDKTVILEAQVLGLLAFEEGKKSTPCLDKNLMDLISRTELKLGQSTLLMDAWSKSWHKANISN